MITVGQRGSARFSPPLVVDSTLIRERLLHALDDAAAPVTLVTGPAGSGKTTCVAAWVAGRPGTVAWVRVDKRDDDPSAFWSAILESLALADLKAVRELQAPPRGAVESFVEALVEALDDTPLTLVIDDLHRLQGPELLASLGDFAAAIPDSVRLVLISRSQPDIRQARLRLDARLSEIDGEDLGFSLEETEGFLQRQGVTVDSAYVRALHRRTEGWVAGVRLAAMAVAAGRDPEAMVPHFGGDDDAVTDYLAAEVLGHLAPETQDFLDRTCGCTQLTVDLARTLTGVADSGEVLEDLVRRNLFTVRLDHRREQYRYHDLLRTYLVARLKRRDPQLFAQLHRATAEWCLEHADAVHAMEHYAMAGDVDALTDLARESGVTAMLDGHSHRLLTLLAQIPPTTRADYLWVLAAACALETDDVRVADAYLHRVTGGSLEDPAFRILAAAVAVARDRYTKDVGPALQQLLTQWDPPSGWPDLDLYATQQKGVACCRQVGRNAEGIEALASAEAIAEATGRDVLRLSCLSFLAGAFVSANDFVNVRRYSASALALAEQRGWSQSQVAAHTHTLISWSCYLQAEPQGALEHAELACTVIGGLSPPGVELAAHTAVIFAKEALGTLTVDDVRSVMADLRRLSDAAMSPGVMSNIGPEMVRICLRLGERTWARETAAMTLENVPDAGEPMLAKAMLLMDAGQPVPARRALEEIVTDKAISQSLVTRISGLVLAALQDAKDGNSARSHALLTEALEIAETPLIRQPFTSRPEVIDLLVRGEGRFGRSEGFARGIVEIAANAEVRQLPTRLTPAELAVLHQLPSLMSIRQIADSRQVSLNTMKAQLRSIYRKLEVSGRKEAVESARRLSLI